ncbi:MAG TPA: FHA domain-containing protein [Gemmataceae bacterium]|nr:FHA domain-containing protein [Gemmataceae bacterium]
MSGRKTHVARTSGHRSGNPGSANGSVQWNDPLAEFARACGLAGPWRVIVRDVATEDREIVLRQPFALVGRSRPRDVRVAAPAVSDRHAYLQVIAGRVYCVDLGSRSGVDWGQGDEVAGWLPADAEVRIGPFTLRIVLPEPQPIATSPAMGLELYQGRRDPTLWSAPPGVTLVGRGSACALRAFDQGLAAYQCALVNPNGSLWVVDLGNEKPTRVNGRPIRLARLRDGDLIQAGRWTAAARRESGHPDPGALVSVSGAMTPAHMAQATAMAFAPFGQMIEQFQQCMLVMGKMFSTMQQEHLAQVRDQIAQLQEVARELRQRQEDLSLPWADNVPDGYALPGAGPPLSKMVTEETVQKLRDAHEWFSQRLAETTGR